MKSAYERQLEHLDAFMPFLPQELLAHLHPGQAKCVEAEEEVEPPHSELPTDESELSTIELSASDETPTVIPLPSTDGDIPLPNTPLEERTAGTADLSEIWFEETPHTKAWLRSLESSTPALPVSSLQWVDVAVLCVVCDSLSAASAGEDAVADLGLGFLDAVIDAVDSCGGIVHSFSDGLFSARFGGPGTAEANGGRSICARGCRSALASVNSLEQGSARAAVTYGPCAVGFLGARGRSAGQLLGQAADCARRLVLDPTHECWVQCEARESAVVVTSEVKRRAPIRMRKVPGGLFTPAGRLSHRPKRPAKVSSPDKVEHPGSEFDIVYAPGTRVVITSPPRNTPDLVGASGVVAGRTGDGGLVVEADGQRACVYPGGVALVAVTLSPKGHNVTLAGETGLGLLVTPMSRIDWTEPEGEVVVVVSGCGETPGGRRELCFGALDETEAVRVQTVLQAAAQAFGCAFATAIPPESEDPSSSEVGGLDSRGDATLPPSPVRSPQPGRSVSLEALRMKWNKTRSEWDEEQPEQRGDAGLDRSPPPVSGQGVGDATLPHHVPPPPPQPQAGHSSAGSKASLALAALRAKREKTRSDWHGNVCSS
eukprot:Hpha_TRINITY_DN15869_c1_g2::TRINITY_DN15869_c1_g2_i5::g.191751::m.191751